MKQTQVKRK